MTTVAHILEQWGMPLDLPEDPEEQWFLDWVLKSPKEVSAHLTAGWHAFGSLREVYGPGEIDSAFEFFGGMGAQALMIQELFRPPRHVVCDYSEEAVRHMQAVLPSPIWVSQQDAYHEELIVPEADLVALDFGNLTAWRTRPKEQQRILLDQVFSTEPKAVVLTDIAGPRLHLQKARYETLLGPDTCGSYATYLDALVGRLEGLYGYELQAGFSHRWSTVMAFVPAGRAIRNPEEEGPPIFVTPDGPKGLELM